MLKSPFFVCTPSTGDIEARDKGSLLAHENGVATPFGITGAQSRGVMMVAPKDEIYRDMIIGLHQRPGDLRVNICKVTSCPRCTIVAMAAIDSLWHSPNPNLSFLRQS